ncbi:MAG: NUDIX domain-containing protein [Phycisphaerales bacterium]|nr:NUDIX domain-containing protein [Phycisphaerales bacterium]
MLSQGAAPNIELIARGVAIQHSRILVCRNLKHGYSYLPGGHIEAGEPAAGALSREFLEESGVDIRVGAFALATEQLFEQRGKARHELSLVFHVDPARGAWPDPFPVLEPKIAFEWIEAAALPESGLLPTAILAWLMAGGCDSPTDRHAEAWLGQPPAA